MNTLLPGLAGVLLLAAAGAAQAEDTALGALEIAAPWARASAGPTGTGAVFMTIRNHGEADRLLAADADVAERVELHTHIMDGDVMRMRRLPAIAVPPGETTLEPGGLHVMLLGLHAPLVEGTSFPLSLTFHDAGTVRLDVPVQEAGAMRHQ